MDEKKPYVEAVEKAGRERVETTISFMGANWDNVVVVPVEELNRLRENQIK